MTINLRHVGLIVSDTDTALKLYRDVFGFVPEIDQVEEGLFFDHLTGLNEGKARTTKCYAHDRSCIELIQFISHSNIERSKILLSSGFNHIALNVDDLLAMEEKLTGIGIKFINEPKMNIERTAMVAFCKDYEENLLELVQTNFL